MTRALAALVLLAAVLGAGCGAKRPLVLPLSANTMPEARQIAARAAKADVVYLGEQHDDPEHHQRQRQVIEAMVARGLRPTIGFEMLDVGQQAELDRALQDSLPAEEVARRLRWQERGWPDFAMYWPIFERARAHGLPVIALDLDPVMARRIAREGLGAAAGDAAGELGSRLPWVPAREIAIERRIQRAHCDMMPESQIPRMVESWHARNVTMARRIAAALEAGRPVVVVAGRGHQEPGGLPDQLAAIRPGTRQLLVDMVEAPGAPADEAVAGPRENLIVWTTPARERPDPCEELRRRFPPKAPTPGARGRARPA